MMERVGTPGLVFNEPLLWEKGATGRCGYCLPRRDVAQAEIAPDLIGEGPAFPDLSELDVVRHYTRLSQWNFSVDSGMYPLGSCTMKYNPKTNDRQAGIPGFAAAHPLLPPELNQGALSLTYHLERYLSAITGLPAVSLQPAAGAHGELTGMLIFHAYHKRNGSPRRKILIPDTAHGTNPASAALCGFTPVTVKSGGEGTLSAAAVAAVMDGDTAGIMITNPNTLGLFETEIRDITRIIHEKGGLVYGDGANMNAVMGIIDMARIGVDILHLNLHKTFSTPHGGGGPGSGPVCVTSALEPFLPVPRVIRQADGTFSLEENFPQSVGKVHAFYGNFGILIRAYAYIRSMGPEDLKKAGQLAVLNANYIKEHLKSDYHLPFDRPCMHECVFSDQHQAHQASTLDIAKRLMEYGFHPPTIYFPLVVPGAMMIEPTETESRETLDRFIDAMRRISDEARSTPSLLHEAPTVTKVCRLDETSAARKPCLCG